jgi:hypothetical protein
MALSKLVLELGNGSGVTTVKALREYGAARGWSAAEVDEMIVLADKGGNVRLCQADFGAPQREGIRVGSGVHGLVVALG